MEKLLVAIGAALVVGSIVWWFFGKHTTTEKEADMSNDMQEVTVTVSGGYTPNTVVLRQGVPAKIVFERKDPSGCFNEVVFPDFGVHEELPVGDKHPIAIDTSKPGEYTYACGMNMFHGKVVIK
ncbi:MAG TPA: cupredoxin domain-containing protein [Candidatus Saccharibacteria bacterium]|nr:cupredoxin domain-containing protein [Candidatus Saccharibacteria bacterium]